MDKLESARLLLEQIKMPAKQQGNLCCLTLLAMAKLKKSTPWGKATNEWMRIHDITPVRVYNPIHLHKLPLVELRIPLSPKQAICFGN